ncbi:MAG TPA: hypothetical protein VFT27_06575 [Actinomycetota bacterium]|nr:hypothetical protein [Actinomycetota bacterium]
MRGSTATRMLVGIIVFMGVAAFLALVKGDPEARELVGGFFFVAVTIGGLLWLGQRYRVGPRRASFQDQARRSGLRAERGDPFGLLDSPYALFGRMASVRDVENTASGGRNGVWTVVVDYWYAPSGDPQHDDYLRYTCVLTDTPAWWPDLSAVPETLVARLRSTFALPDVRTESEAFNRRFEVRSADARFASAFLDARMIEWLLQVESGVGFEIRGARLMTFRPRSTTSLDDVGLALGLHDALSERIPRVVRTAPI